MEFVPLEDNLLSIGEDVGKQNANESLYSIDVDMNFQLPPYGVKLLSTSHAGYVADENNICMDFGTFVERSGILAKSSKKFKESNVCNTDTAKANTELQSIMKKESSMDTKSLSKNVHFGFPVAWMKYYTEDPDENASTASTEILFSDDEGEENEPSLPKNIRDGDQEVPLNDDICEPCNKRICLENEDSSKFIPSFHFPDVISIPSLDIFTKKPPAGKDISRDIQNDEYQQHQHHDDDSSSSNSFQCNDCSSPANKSKPTDVVQTLYSCEQSPLQHTTSNGDDDANVGADTEDKINGQDFDHSEEIEQQTNDSIVPFQNPLRNHGESTTLDQIPDTDMDANLECMDTKIWSCTGERSDSCTRESGDSCTRERGDSCKRETDDVLQQNSPAKENAEGTIINRNTSEAARDPSNHYTDFIDMAWDQTLHSSTDTEVTQRTSRHGEMQMVPNNVGCDETSVIEDGTRITSHRVCSSVFHLGEEALLDEVILNPLCISDSPSKIFLAKSLIESDETPFYDESNLDNFPQLILSDTIIQNPEISSVPDDLLPKETPSEKECFSYADMDGESCSSQISDTPTEVQPLAESLKSEEMATARMKGNQNCPLNKKEKESSSKENLQENEGALQTQFQQILENRADELDGPELLHMAMQLMETALKKAKKPMESECLQIPKSVAAVDTMKALPAFTWKKFNYNSQSVVQSSISEEAQEAVDTPQAINHYRKLYINNSCSRPIRVGLSKRQRSHSTMPHQPHYAKPASISRDSCQEVPKGVYEKEGYQKEY